MALTRQVKQEIVEEMKETFSESEAVVVFDCKGLTVAESSELRNMVKKDGAKMRVVKNRLTKIALRGTPYEHISDLFKGQAAITSGEDPVAVAKSLAKFAKNNDKVTIIGGALADKKLTKDEVVSLASMPSLDDLRAKIIATIQTPAINIARLLNAPSTGVVRVLDAKSKQG